MSLEQAVRSGAPFRIKGAIKSFGLRNPKLY